MKTVGTRGSAAASALQRSKVVEKTGLIGELMWKSLFTSFGDLFTMSAEPLALWPNSNRCS